MCKYVKGHYTIFLGKQSNIICRCHGYRYRLLADKSPNTEVHKSIKRLDDIWY